MASNVGFRRNLFLLKSGLPYECVFGEKPSQWPNSWLNAATHAFSEMINPMTGE